VRAIAITGSLARGDADRASDVDLWLVGDRDAREQVPHPRADVTLLWQTPRSARRHDTLLRYEVQDAQIVYDPRGLLARVRERFATNRQALREEMTRETAFVITDLVMSAQRLPLEPAIALLRESARRAAALRLYLDHGWRVPRWRHFAQHLSRAAFTRLRDIQSLPVEQGPWRSLTRFLRIHDDELAPLRSRRAHYPPPLPSRERVLWLSRRGARPRALLLLRSALEEVAFGRQRDELARALWRKVHGFDRRAPAPVQLRRLATKCATLVRTLSVEDSIDPRWEIVEKLRSLAGEA
jgi:hypothetical protein